MSFWDEAGKAETSATGPLTEEEFFEGLRAAFRFRRTPEGELLRTVTLSPQAGFQDGDIVADSRTGERMIVRTVARPVAEEGADYPQTRPQTEGGG